MTLYIGFTNSSIYIQRIPIKKQTNVEYIEWTLTMILQKLWIAWTQIQTIITKIGFSGIFSLMMRFGQW